MTKNVRHVRSTEFDEEDCEFHPSEPFLVVWISDSGHEIMAESVRQLNSAPVAREFLDKFG